MEQIQCGMNLIRDGMTSFTDRIGTFCHGRSTFFDGMTSFTDRMNTFCHGTPPFTDGMSTFCHGRDPFHVEFASFHVKFASFLMNLLHFMHNLSSFAFCNILQVFAKQNLQGLPDKTSSVEPAQRQTRKAVMTVNSLLRSSMGMSSGRPAVSLR